MFEAELREFLEADTSPVSVDPRFRESLRKRLWRMVQVEAAERRRSKKQAEPKSRKPSKRSVAPARRDD